MTTHQKEILANKLLCIVLFNAQKPPSGTAIFPQQAVKILKEKKIQGQVFSSMRWGGYLIWHLYPAVKPFIDGRAIDQNKFIKYTHMLWTTKYGKLWFAQEKFDLVLMPLQNRFSQERYSLVSYLLSDPSWQLLSQEKGHLLFQKI